MRRVYDLVTSGNPLRAQVGATVTVNTAGGPPAVIYDDLAGTILATNPVTTDARGAYSFYAPDGLYDLIYQGTNLTTLGITNLELSSALAISATIGAGSGSPIAGAAADGVTNDTVALQAAIDAVPTTGGALVLPAIGTFKSGNLTVTNKTNFLFTSLGAAIQWTGTASGTNYIGIQLVGTLTNCTFEDLILVGDAVVANRHAGIWNLNGPTFVNIKFRNNTVRDVVFGLGLGANGGGGTINSAEISGNYIDNVQGVLSGTGYGIYHGSTWANPPAHVRIVNNTISRAHRHSIYQGEGGGVVIEGNTIRLHRTGDAVAGSPLSAIVVARSHDVIVANNMIASAEDNGIDIASGTGLICYNVTVSGNVITNGSAVSGSLPGISIGTSNPAVNGGTIDITVIGNTIFTTGAVANPHIYIFEGTRLNIVGNSSYVMAVPGTMSSLYLAGFGETAGSATYTTDVMVKDNLFHGTNNGGNYTPIELGSLFAASAGRVEFVHNRLIMPGNAFSLDGAQTNPNVYVHGQAVTGLTRPHWGP